MYLSDSYRFPGVHECEEHDVLGKTEAELETRAAELFWPRSYADAIGRDPRCHCQEDGKCSWNSEEYVAETLNEVVRRRLINTLDDELHGAGIRINDPYTGLWEIAAAVIDLGYTRNTP